MGPGLFDLASERVQVNVDTNVHPDLVNSRFVDSSVSRESHDAQIYTNNAANLAGILSRDVSKNSAVVFGKEHMLTPNVAREQTPLAKNISVASLGLAF